jgi:two-component system, NtrC family, nitrogen regulation sensor histidine kinase NtrY
MVFSRFRIQCFLRLALICATMFFFLWLISHRQWYVTSGLALVAVLFQMWLLFRYVESAGRGVRRFLEAVRNSDFSGSFDTPGGGTPFADLDSSFEKILERFRVLRAEREEQYHYLQTVVQHVGVGLISFRADGEVELLNTAARRILGISQMKNIRELESVSPHLAESIAKLKAGERTLVKLEEEGEELQLSLHATAFTLGDCEYTLVSLHNIQSELEEKEMEAWQNLIRVLTHEIMNSITPIASLASTVNNLLEKSHNAQQNLNDSETDDDIRGAVQTIEQRSRGLLHFVDNYRNLTRIPRPRFRIVSVKELFDNIERLMRDSFVKTGVVLTVSVEPEELEITVDPELLEQVLINLTQNAVQALENRKDGRINLQAGVDSHGRTFLQVVDNGPGIMPDVIAKVFIPFFTTRREGSGIGLSLSRQIMRLHGGAISVRSEPGVETVFTLRL